MKYENYARNLMKNTSLATLKKSNVEESKALSKSKFIISDSSDKNRQNKATKNDSCPILMNIRETFIVPPRYANGFETSVLYSAFWQYILVKAQKKRII